jgi:hypothetical protein
VLLRLTYLGVTNAFALPRLLAMNDHQQNDIEILVLRHQITVPQRQLGPDTMRLAAADRALLAALAHRLPCLRCAGRGCWRGRTRSCAGTAICSPADTPPDPDPSALADLWGSKTQTPAADSDVMAHRVRRFWRTS